MKAHNFEPAQKSDPTSLEGDSCALVGPYISAQFIVDEERGSGRQADTGGKEGESIMQK